jgi:hypothetical protein
MSEVSRRRRIIGSLAVTIAGLCISAVVSCGGDDPADCRFDPRNCDGDFIGAYCRFHDECETGYCCNDSHCGGGMCTVPCHGDGDCPVDMGCEHDKCFFRCQSAADCAAGQSCEHKNTVCEWP